MDTNKLLANFFSAIDQDPRINTTHISVYVSLIQFWQIQEFKKPMKVFSHEIKKISKVSGNGTYLRSIHDLNDYGYLKYFPSYNKNEGSEVELLV